MAERRPIVLINGSLRELPLGDTINDHLVLITTASGDIEQLPSSSDVNLFRPVVMVGGELSQLPIGDTLAGLPTTWEADRTHSYVIIGARNGFMSARRARHLVIVGGVFDGTYVRQVKSYAVAGATLDGVSLRNAQTYVIWE